MDADRVRIQALHWIETIVIGLDLCPFARRSIDAERLRVEVSDARTEDELAKLFVAELHHLESTAGADLDSTLIVHPLVFQDFIEFNDFLGVAEALLEAEGFQEKFQVASFHPDYRFEGADPDAIANFTHRSPHPMLHLLRESSVSRAVDAHPDPESIPSVNITRLEALGMPALRRLLDS
jgi:hypothetical protein